MITLFCYWHFIFPGKDLALLLYMQTVGKKSCNGLQHSSMQLEYDYLALTWVICSHCTLVTLSRWMLNLSVMQWATLASCCTRWCLFLMLSVLNYKVLCCWCNLESAPSIRLPDVLKLCYHYPGLCQDHYLWMLHVNMDIQLIQLLMQIRAYLH